MGDAAFAPIGALRSLRAGLGWTAEAAVSTSAVVTLEQMVTALLVAVKNPALGIQGCERAGDSFGEGVKRLASHGFQRHPAPGVTLQSKVIA